MGESMVATLAGSGPAGSSRRCRGARADRARRVAAVSAVLFATAAWGFDAFAQDDSAEAGVPAASFPPADASAAAAQPAAETPQPTAVPSATATPGPTTPFPVPAAPPPTQPSSRDAREADDLSKQAPGQDKPRRRWYGWQTLLVDGLTGMATIAALDSRDRSDVAGAFVFVGAGAFVVGTPIVHFAHGHAGKGLASLAIRGGCAGALGLGAGKEAPQLMALLLLGLVAAIPIDAAILAREDVSAERAAGTGPAIESLHLASTLDPPARGFTLSAVGRF
jgi:hypothetical protein